MFLAGQENILLNTKQHLKADQINRLEGDVVSALLIESSTIVYVASAQ